MAALHAKLSTIALLVGFIAVPMIAAAQEEDPTAEITRLRAAVAERERALASIISSQNIDDSYPINATDKTAIAAAKAEAWRAFYTSQASLNKNGDELRLHQQRVFSWQLTAANWILFVVVVICLSGVLFAGYELSSTRRLVSKVGAIGQNPPAADGAAQGEAEAANVPGAMVHLTLEPNKIQITSAVVGIVVLAMSLGFLYLFLREVYQINVIDLTGSQNQAAVVNGRPNPEASAGKPTE